MGKPLCAGIIAALLPAEGRGAGVGTAKVGEGVGGAVVVQPVMAAQIMNKIKLWRTAQSIQEARD